jgi:hypothetical protein
MEPVATRQGPIRRIFAARRKVPFRVHLAAGGAAADGAAPPDRYIYPFEIGRQALMNASHGVDRFCILRAIWVLFEIPGTLDKFTRMAPLSSVAFRPIGAGRPARDARVACWHDE